MSALRLGFLVPHLNRVGGIRRMLEFGNRLVDRGHAVTFVVPDGAPVACTWMECRPAIVPIAAAASEPWDVVVFTHEPQWFLLERFTNARRKVFYALHDGSSYGKEGSWEAAFAPVDVQLANSN